MEDVSNSMRYPGVSRLNDRTGEVAWQKLIIFTHKNYWGLIIALATVTFFLELAEHLSFIENPEPFFYMEIILITILLAITGMQKSTYVERVRTMADNAQKEMLLAMKGQAVRQEIARDLHDTIGQNISYLRMKLEQLAEAGPDLKVDLDRELKRMSEVANESYDLMRGTLAALQARDSSSLRSLLASHAHTVAERSSFQVEFTSQGNSRPLAPATMRQVFYLFREAFCNIEKHSHASQVCVELDWTEQMLVLNILDNGQGFDQSRLDLNNHYGLKIMRQRAERLNGQFSIDSQAGAGTSLVIRIPYP